MRVVPLQLIYIILIMSAMQTARKRILIRVTHTHTHIYIYIYINCLLHDLHISILLSKLFLLCIVFFSFRIVSLQQSWYTESNIITKPPINTSLEHLPRQVVRSRPPLSYITDLNPIHRWRAPYVYVLHSLLWIEWSVDVFSSSFVFYCDMWYQIMFHCPEMHQCVILIFRW